mmetsp:Transcript_62647/g.198364  ORF Transcript_62647/g.198364 Transcript_62647/m.198364 type:complete len:224 (+) Transcript_62647:996-1667(+)
MPGRMPSATKSMKAGRGSHCSCSSGTTRQTSASASSSVPIESSYDTCCSPRGTAPSTLNVRATGRTYSPDAVTSAGGTLMDGASRSCCTSLRPTGSASSLDSTAERRDDAKASRWNDWSSRNGADRTTYVRKLSAPARRAPSSTPCASESRRSLARSKPHANCTTASNPPSPHPRLEIPLARDVSLSSDLTPAAGAVVKSSPISPLPPTSPGQRTWRSAICRT